MYCLPPHCRSALCARLVGIARRPGSYKTRLVGIARRPGSYKIGSHRGARALWEPALRAIGGYRPGTRLPQNRLRRGAPTHCRSALCARLVVIARGAGSHKVGPRRGLLQGAPTKSGCSRWRGHRSRGRRRPHRPPPPRCGYSQEVRPRQQADRSTVRNRRHP